MLIMKPTFNEHKTTQAAALFLKLHGGQMNDMKLIKLLYIADRKALLTWGRPMTYDCYVSMDHGPVLSKTLDLINEGAEPGQEIYWNQFISAPKKYIVKLLQEPPFDELSQELIPNLYVSNAPFHRSRTASATALDRIPANFPARCFTSGANALFDVF